MQCLILPYYQAQVNKLNLLHYFKELVSKLDELIQ